MKSRTILAMMMLAAAFEAGAWQRGWSWEMPADVYKDLDFSTRPAVDRAARIFSQAWDCRNGSSLDTIPRFRAAAAEWKKVQIQCEGESYDERLLAYSQFIQAFALLNARDRNEAIKLFNEVLDLYADEAWIACPAIYWLGQTYFSMGETRRGLEEMRRVAEEGKYMKSPLWASANNILAGDAWNSDKAGMEEKARDYWLAAADGRFWELARDAFSEARGNLQWYAFATEDYSTFEEYFFAGVGEKDFRGRTDRIMRVWNDMCWQLDNGMVRQHYNRMIKKDKDRNAKLGKIRVSWAEWIDRQEPVFAEAKRDFDFDMFTLDVWRWMENDEKSMKRINKILKKVKGVADKKEREGRYRAVAMKLCSFNKFVEARTVVENLDDPKARLYLLADVESAAGDFGKVVKILDELLTTKPEQAEEMSLKRRIRELCHRRTGDLQRAVKLYLELPEPPGTLWGLQDCYRQMGEKKKSYATLVEIQSMFPPEAPQAVYTMAKYYEADGDKTKAIALYRRLLSQPEWKQTQQSSQAHQDLERLGIATGGAMINAVR